MQKQIGLPLFVLLLLVSLSACEDGSGGRTARAVPPMEGAGTVGSYQVELKQAALAQSPNGSPILVITYAWTNNSQETTSAAATIQAKAFQDGVELQPSAPWGVHAFYSAAASKNMRPGMALDVPCAFVLTSDTTPVEVQLSAFLNPSAGRVVKTFDPAELS